MKFNATQNFQALKGHKGSMKLIQTAQPQTSWLWSRDAHEPSKQV